MKHFISIVIDNDGINESRDFVLDTVLNTANIGLLENTMEYEIYESENNTQVLSIPIARELNEKQQAYLAKKLANKLFDKGYNNFDIEFSINEAALNEAAPTTFTPTHYGGPGGLNNVMLHTDGNLYFQKQRDDGQPGREIVRWNGNPTGEGFFGKWNPATIKGTIVNGQRVPYPAGTNFNNAPRAAAPAAPAAAGNGTLRRGSRGPAVRKLQLDLGVQPADGVFGPATEAAVKDFQQRMMPGEAADGIVGPKTNTAIQQSAAIDTGDNPEIEKSDPRSQFAALSGFATSRRGGIANNPSQVDAIKELQAELKRRGLLDGEVDGKYGPQTRAAVRAFQEQNDLYVDGDAGPRTIQKLMQREDPNITMTPLDEPQDQTAADGRISGADQIDVDNNRDGPNNNNERIQGALPQNITDQYNQTLADKDYIAMLRLVDQYQVLYNRFAELENPEGEGTLYDWLTAKAADDSSDFPGAEEPAVQQQAPAGVAVGDVATQEQSDTLKAINPTNYPMPGEKLNQADVDALNDTDDLASDTIAALDANPTQQGELSATDQAQTGTAANDQQQDAAGSVVEWEELDTNAAPEGYTLFIKRQETPVFTYGLEGGEPVDTEYATQREAVAAAANDKQAAEAPELEIFDNQPRGYGMEQGKVIVKRGERYFEVDVSRTRNFNGQSRYRGSSLPGYEYDADNPQAPSRTNADAVYFDPETFDDVTTNVANVEPRPTASGVQGDYGRNDWDQRYGETHNADGTPKANESVEPMPKGAFMVEDRAIWRSLYESTHYTNGKPRPRTFITESKMQEVTFDDDDKFFEN